MLAPALITTLLAAAPAKVRVDVLEFTPQSKRVPGAEVTLRETRANPTELKGRTDATGRVWFEVPHLDFEPVEVLKDGYVTRAEMQPWSKEVGKAARKELHRGVEMHWVVYVYPRSAWKYEIKAGTRAAAVALADEYGRECRAGGPTQVELYEPGFSWTVHYPCLRVIVDGKTGASTVLVKKPVTSTPMYPPADALRDALSNPLEFLERMQSDPHDIPQCAYRNRTVFVLDDYCTKKEINSTGITVIHPERGTVHLYAEAKSPISRTRREDWDQWHFETDDPYPGASITMRWREIAKHEGRRRTFMESRCWADLTSERGGTCTNKTDDIKAWWEGVYRPFMKDPPPTWNTLVNVLRGYARNNGKPDPRGPIMNPVMPETPPMRTSDGAGRFGITVEVEEYMLGKPVAAARVTLRDSTGKGPALSGLTNARGKVRFAAPHLDYELASITHPELLPFEEVEPIKDLFKSIETRRTANGTDELKLWQLVVNRRWLDATMKVRTPAQAVEIADVWGRACGGKPTRVTRPHSWKVEYPCVVVHVDAWEGGDFPPTVTKLTPDEVSGRELYPPHEALADALGSPLKHVGTGVWPGRYKVPSCAYRNDKVVVLDSWCTLRETERGEVWILHPERGLAVVHATAEDERKSLGEVAYGDYEQWGLFVGDPYPGLDLAMSFRQLTDWEKRQNHPQSPGGISQSVQATYRGQDGCAPVS